MAISKPFAYNPSTSFSIGSGFNNTVNVVAIQSDGKTLAGGVFTTFSGASQNYLIRLNSDGSKDSTFNIGSGFNDNVLAIAIQSDGKILVGGVFTTFTGSSQNCLIRLNSDGSKDSTFNIGSGFDATTSSIEIQSDGKIILAGYFSTYQGSSQNGLIRLNSDGSKDASFNIGTGLEFAYIGIIKIQSDGKVVAGGQIASFNGQTTYNLIRLNSNGSIDSSFNIGTGFNNPNRAISIQSDGKIIVGGGFTTFSGSSQNYLIRLNSDGSKDTSFNIGSGFNSFLLSTEVQSDGKILVGGLFTTFSGSSQNGLIRLNSDGSKDTSFNIGSGFNGWSITFGNNIKIQSDGNIIVGAGFTTFNGLTQNRLVKLNSNGSIFSGTSTPISGTTQYGDLVVGNIQTEYSANYGGIKWWGGPDEELGYVVGNARPVGQPVPAGVTGGPAYVGFFRSTLLTDNSFLSLANYIGGQNSQPPFATTSAAVTWLNANGYYTSYVV